MDRSRLFHNPGCSKSRDALTLLRSRGVQPEVVYYLERPPSADELHQLLRMLGMPARGLLRTSEAAYSELGLDDPRMSDEALVQAMHEHPQLIERPVFVRGGRAVIGRPPERVLQLLG